MQTVLSKTGIEVCYPCIIHLLHNGESFECEYKSDHVGLDLLKFVCKIQKIEDIAPWGLKFVDTGNADEHRYWLDMNKLVWTQVKAISPTRFYFRVKVYPPEPYKISDQAIRHPIFQQLRLDLLGGRLFCNIKEASMLVALLLHYTHGEYTQKLVWLYIMYIKSKILRKERCSPQFFLATEKRALEIYQKLLAGLSKLEIEDLVLRLAGKLKSYGTEPFLVRNIDKEDILLCMNYTGLWGYGKKKEVFRMQWQDISKITHEGKCLFSHLTVGGVMVFECVNFSECNYIWSIAVDHLIEFTSPKYLSPADQKYFGEDALSEMSSFFGSCITEYKCTRFESDVLEEQLEISCSLMRLLDFSSWRSQLSLIYAVLLLCVMGSHTTVFDQLPYVYSIKNGIKEFVSTVLFNKMMVR